MGDKKKAKTKLTAADIKQFKALLMAKRAEILGSVNAMENESLKKSRSDLSSLPIHMADVGSDNYELENTLGLMDSERKILEQIHYALQRIEDGTYGICEGNEEPIKKERLEAIPWTRYCIACASQHEKGMSQGRDDRSNYVTGPGFDLDEMDSMRED